MLQIESMTPFDKAEVRSRSSIMVDLDTDG